MGEDDNPETVGIFALIAILSTLLVLLFLGLANCACWILIFYYREYRERREEQDDIERDLRRSRTTRPPPQIPTRESPGKEVHFRAKIEVVTYDQEKMQNKSDPCCAICLAESEDGDDCAAVERCQHMYHRECIETWLKQGSLRCPCCSGLISPQRRLIPASDQSS